MRKKYGLALAAALLFVGGGCAPAKQPADDASMGIEAEADSRMMAPEASGDVDADVEAMLRAADEETAAETDAAAESGVSEGGSDLELMMEGSYDIE